jgi:hypothetical protein
MISDRSSVNTNDMISDGLAGKENVSQHGKARTLIVGRLLLEICEGMRILVRRIGRVVHSPPSPC